MKAKQLNEVLSQAPESEVKLFYTPWGKDMSIRSISYNRAYDSNGAVTEEVITLNLDEPDADD